MTRKQHCQHLEPSLVPGGVIILPTPWPLLFSLLPPTSSQLGKVLLQTLFGDTSPPD